MAPLLKDYLARHPSFQDPSSSSSPLPSLYSDLSRQRRSNPAGFRANVEWWKHILTQVAWDGVQQSNALASSKDDVEKLDSHQAAGRSAGASQDRLVLHLNETTKTAWSIDHVGRPLGLGTVVAELQSTSDVVSLATFLRSTKPIHGPSHSSGFKSYVPSAGTVASTLLVAPFTWAFSQIGIGGSGDDDDDGGSQDDKLWKTHRGDWVIWANLEKVTDAFLQEHYASASLSPLDSLFSTAKFKDKLAKLKLEVGSGGAPFQLSEMDVQVVIKHLVRDRKVAVMDKGIVKLSPREHEPPTPISEQDIGILQIADTSAKLEMQIAEIEKKIAERNDKIKAALQAKQKGQALSYLRSRKTLEDLLNKRMGSLETISGVLIKVEQAAGDVEIMQAYETSASTLKSLMAHPSLQHERVDETMAALSDTLADHAEIEQAIQLGGESARAAAGVEEVEDAELEQEMEMLAREKEREEREEEERRKKEEEERRKAEAEAERKRAREEEAEKRRRAEKERFEEERRRKEERERELKERAAQRQPDESTVKEGGDATPAPVVDKETRQAVAEE
ncbi:uncharacterized protein PFL1_00584 [Pseudozyma flocculosa PF-1]|uniref:Snf7-domain-containing protein n=1 Tax=Pseudozyma flocculosa TaxID=84751 RepID=A0A5C3ER12_9BASI|nr:uncharacterized protein PFL1_00584 [Pseudozyma flocculosa PF-1]EPQ32388.1 hypothetical protein PFL1_00584 [Pseudozyma flocculosa PF-1]SPO34638.1 uncharacterized protein PSFLO_00109 [Pseudozyma flocculosa]